MAWYIYAISVIEIWMLLSGAIGTSREVGKYVELVSESILGVFTCSGSSSGKLGFRARWFAEGNKGLEAGVGRNLNLRGLVVGLKQERGLLSI